MKREQKEQKKQLPSQLPAIPHPTRNPLESRYDDILLTEEEMRWEASRRKPTITGQERSIAIVEQDDEEDAEFFDPLLLASSSGGQRAFNDAIIEGDEEDEGAQDCELDIREPLVVNPLSIAANPNAMFGRASSGTGGVRKKPKNPSSKCILC